jgi:hypothetical protein
MRRPSPATVISCVALFVSLGGVSYAVTALPKNSVGTKQIKTGGVESGDVKDKTLKLQDFSASARAGLTGATGPQGATGAQGPKGDAGTNGTNGTKGDKGDTGETGPGAAFVTARADQDDSVTTSVMGTMTLDDFASTQPSVNVTVPASGTVEVYAEAKIVTAANGNGAVGLAIDGTAAAAVVCNGVAGMMMIAVPGTSLTHTTGAPVQTLCGSTTPGQPQSLIVTGITPGAHTFSLIYGETSTNGSSTTVHFSLRRISVAPRP